MKFFLVTYFILLNFFSFAGKDEGNKFTLVYRQNKLKEEGNKAFQKGDYKTAILKYGFLLDSMDVKSDAARLNLSHSYLLSGDTVSALRNYQQLVSGKDPKIVSTAFQQMGAIQFNQKQYKDAIASTKQALRSNPRNEEARYNYELLKKILDEQKQNENQNKDDKKDNKDEQKKDEEKKDEQDKKDQEKKGDQEKKDQEKKDQEKQDEGEEEKDEKGEKGEKKEDDKEKDGEKKEGDQGEKDKKEDEQQEKQGQQGEKDKDEKDKKEEQMAQEEKDKKDDEKGKDSTGMSRQMRQMSISPEKARMILEAMRNSEKQYLQQMRKVPTKPRDKKGPDW